MFVCQLAFRTLNRTRRNGAVPCFGMATFITRLAESGPGLRLGVKDLIDLAGTPTTSGSKVIAAGAPLAEQDARCLAGTRAAETAGQVTIVGKTNLHELGFGVSGINPWFGTPVNPLDARLIPGGSSSGSAVAVGAGELDVAFGSDSGGSIRIPAACCGVVGLKTSRGRVSLEGVRPLAPSLDTVGPMASTVARVTAGMTLLEPGFAPASSPGHRIGRLRLPAAEHVDAALDEALRAAGFEVVDIGLPGWDEANLASITILMAEAWQVHHELWKAHQDNLSPDVSARLEASSLIEPEEVAACWETARAWVDELARVFRQVEALALPTLASDPPELSDAARVAEIRYSAPFNLAGLPAISLPVRPVSTGATLPSSAVPPSLQLAGPLGSEELILATAEQVEAAAGHGVG
jgi:amidase